MKKLAIDLLIIATTMAIFAGIPYAFECKKLMMITWLPAIIIFDYLTDNKDSYLNG